VTDSARTSYSLVALGAAVLTFGSAVAPAASTAAFMTPKAMAKKIHGFVPQIPTGNRSAPSTITATSCQGQGRARKGMFATFRCKATWERGKSYVWARALPGGRFCASSTGLSACPAGRPVAGDPRICRNGSVPPTADPNHCALTSTEAVLLRAMRVNFANPSWQFGNLACNGSNLTWKCTFQQLNVFGVYYTSTIKFAQASGSWTATIHTRGGNGKSTCTGQPDGTTAAGKPSKWSAGPTPTCA
jgi:hypothetical protein